MNKVAHYLQQHLVGEVLTSPDVLDYYSTDESIFKIKPMLVVHPRNENDLRKASRFTWQLAERGRVVPITIKGKGTDQTGASLGRGIILSTPAHMNKIIELDPKSGVVSVEAGALIGKVQQTLHTHGRFLPSVSSASEYATIGGAVANNDASSTSYKYGPIREFVKELRLVLSNGELIRTNRLSKRELNKKLGLASFEGEIYRSLDKLIEESSDVIASLDNLGIRNNVGYALNEVKKKDGSFDLTPLIVGSQGTLGLVSEVTFETVPHTVQNDYVIGVFNKRDDAWNAVKAINKIKEGPACIDFIDKTIIEFIQKTNPNLVKTTLEKSIPETVLFIEIEKSSARMAKKLEKKVKKILQEENAEVEIIPASDADNWLALKDSPSIFMSQSDTKARALPLIDDSYVPIENCSALITRVETLMNKASVGNYALWGQAGSGMIHISPAFDLSQVGDRQKMFKVLEEFYKMVVEAGGSVAGEFAEGRLRGGQVAKVLTPEQIDLMIKVKTIFDPFGVLNPGVKVNVDPEALKSQLRNSYSLDHQYSHLPRS